MIEPKMAGDYVDWPKDIPKELWEQIIVQAENPALITTCKLFKEIIYDPAISVRNLEANFKDQFPITFAKAKNRDNVAILKIARMLLLERLTSLLPKETLDNFETTENLNYYSFKKILDDEYCFNLSQIFEIFFDYQFMDKINKESSRAKKSDVIYDIIKENPDYISNIKNLELHRLNLTMIPNEIEIFTEVKKINLSFNKISNIPNSFGKNWSMLEYCDLSCNELKTLPNDFGKTWTKLQQLELIKNIITELPEEFGSTWDNLYRIDFSQNNIQTVPQGFGKNWTHLKIFGCFNNNINSLPADFGSHWKNLVMFRSGNNPLKLDENEIKEKTNKNVRIIQ